MNPYTISGLGNGLIGVVLSDDGVFPNNGSLPLIVYADALPKLSPTAEAFEELFALNKWQASWRNGVYPYHHYHSTAHEMLGCFSGEARVLFGGDSGYIAELTAGSAVLIPAGVAHKRLSSSEGFAVAAAYLPGQKADMCYGNVEERPDADLRICALSKPEFDPVLGLSGPAATAW